MLLLLLQTCVAKSTSTTCTEPGAAPIGDDNFGIGECVTKCPANIAGNFQVADLLLIVCTTLPAN